MRFHVLGRILGAQGLSSLGTSMSTIALAFMVNKLTGSVLHMGAVMAVSTFPLVITSFVGGALLDRFSTRGLMVLSDLIRAALIFSMPFLAQEALGYIYMVAALMGICSAVFNPGQIKLIGELAEREKLVRANSYLSVSRDGAELVGFLVGGVLVTFVGYTLTFMLDAGSYVLSALLLIGLPKPAPRTGAAPRMAELIAESPRVFGRLWKHPGLRTNLLLAVFPLLVVMMNVPNSYGLALDVFERGAAGLAALEVVTASGLILGGLVISRMSLKGDKNRYVFGALLVMAGCFIAVSFSGFFWLSIGLMGVAGMANVGLFVPSITMYQEVPSDRDKGRLIALRAGFGQMGSTGGLLLGGILGEALGITRLFLVAGLVGIGLAFVIYAPYRIAANRRARKVWATTVARGVSRREATAAARSVAEGGALVGAGRAAAAWEEAGVRAGAATATTIMAAGIEEEL